MDGMLSQEEINALLAGASGSGDYQKYYESMYKNR